MEPNTQERPRQVEITDAAHIADVVDSLGNATHSLTVTLDNAPTAFPVRLSAVDPERHQLTLTLTDAQSLHAADIGEQALTLRAESLSDTLHFKTLAPLDVCRDGDCLTIACRLPRALYTTSKRRSLRIPFIQGMHTRAYAAVLPTQPPVAGELRNLSAGGCLMEVPFADSPFFKVGDTLPTVGFEFPNGEKFIASGTVRHVGPAGRTHNAAVGIAFHNLSPERQNRLVHYVNEAEHEAAYRSGHGGRLARPSPLFQAPLRSRRQAQQQRDLTESTPLVRTLREVARQLHITLLALKNDQPISSDAMLGCADTLLRLLTQRRQQCLYALACLGSEPQWIQHSINVAAKLGDLMLAEPEYASRARAAVAAALLHDMGKALLLDESLHSLEGSLDDAQRERLREHVVLLLDRLAPLEGIDTSLRHDIIGCINERLDGSGYPHGYRAESLSAIARMAAVVDVLDAMMRPRGDRPAKTAIEAYRYLYNRPERFDKHWVTRYVQRHGFYPIGCLVRFSHGYLAWVMELDETGQPNRARVVRNTSRSELAMNHILSRVDFGQLGQLDRLIRPEAYRLTPF